MLGNDQVLFYHESSHKITQGWKDGENLWLGIDWCLNILVHADNCRSGHLVREIRQGSSGSFGEGLCPGIESM